MFDFERLIYTTLSNQAQLLSSAAHNRLSISVGNVSRDWNFIVKFQWNFSEISVKFQSTK